MKKGLKSQKLNVSKILEAISKYSEVNGGEFIIECR